MGVLSCITGDGVLSAKASVIALAVEDGGIFAGSIAFCKTKGEEKIANGGFWFGFVGWKIEGFRSTTESFRLEMR